MVFLILLLLGLLTLFASLGMAMQGYSRARVAEQFEKAGRPNAMESFVIARPRYVLAMLILRAAAILAVFLTALAAMGVFDPAGRWARLTLGCALVLALVLFFGVGLPLALSKHVGAALIVRLLPLATFLRILLSPVIVVLEIADPLIRRLVGVPERDAQSHADEFEQEILSAINEGQIHGAVDEEEKEMIESVIELSDTRVEEIMTPRTEMVAVPSDADLEAILATIRAKGHSRIPVFQETIDAIVGVLYAKDLLHHMNEKPFDVTRIMRKTLYVPESKLVRDLLREFREKKVHIAVVLDEYGGTAGLATIEDILEELVGEISDEYDKEAPAELKRIDEQTVEVDARMRIDELNDELRIALPEDDNYDTIGGFVFSTLGKMPRVGERCEHANVGIQVIGAEPQRITKLRIRIKPPAENQPTE